MLFPGSLPAVPGRPGLHGRRLASVSPAWLLAALVAGTGSLSANTISTWTLTTGGDWNTAANWTDGVVPNAVAATAYLDNNLASQTIDLTSDITLGRLLAANPFTTGAASTPLTLRSSNGSKIIFDNASSNASFSMYRVNPSDPRAFVIDVDMELKSHTGMTTQTTSAGGGWTINGKITGDGDLLGSSVNSITLAGDNSGWNGNVRSTGSNIIYTTASNLGRGTIGGGGPDHVNNTTTNLRRNATTDVTLDQAFDLGNAVNNPKNVTLLQRSNRRTTLTTDSITGTTGEFRFGTAGDFATAPFYFELTGDFTMSPTSGGIRLTGNTATQAMVAELNSSGTQTISRITGTTAGGTGGNVVRGRSSGTSNAGTTIISGNSTYGGTTTIKAGTLLVNGTHAYGTGKAGAYTVEAGMLGGIGTITADVFIDEAGILSPGTSIGTLTVAGDVDLAGTLLIELDAAASDRLAVTGELYLPGSTLQLSRLGQGPFDPGLPYVIATYGELNGTFAEIQGDYLSIDYNYQGSNQIVVFVPEPSAAATIFAGAVAIGLIARRPGRQP